MYIKRDIVIIQEGFIFKSKAQSEKGFVIVLLFLIELHQCGAADDA